MPPALLNTPLDRWVRVFETSKHEQQSETIVEPPKTIIEVECLSKMNKDFDDMMSDIQRRILSNGLITIDHKLLTWEDGSDWT